MRVDRNNEKNLKTLENNNLVNYFKLNEERHGPGLAKNDQVTNFQTKIAHIHQNKRVNSHIKRL